MNIATGFVRVTWLTPDLSATVGRFRERLGFLVEEDPGDAIRSLAAPGRPSARAAVRLAGAEIELVAAGASAGGTRQEGTDEERLAEVSVVAGGDPAPAAAEHPNGASALAGIGWATVDRDRAVQTDPDVEFLPAGRDEALGAEAWIRLPGRAEAGRGAVISEPRLVLLEPVSEGRLAAHLARRGEGAAALYLSVASGGWDALPSRTGSAGERLRGPFVSPFGPAYLVPPERPWGPFILFVRVPPSE